MEEKELLFTPLKIGTRTAPNRIVLNAMECCDALDNGDPSPATYKRYEDYFRGQAGLVILEAITPQYDYIARRNQLSIKEHNIPALKKFIAHLKEINPETLIFFQITHSGEISNNVYSQRIRVTEEPLPGYEDAKLVREDEIEQVIKDYVLGSQYAYEVGADGVDLKLCHGYLGTQILRPYNKDNWKYGGSWENRRQFAIDIYDRTRAAIPDENFVLGSKISVWEGFPGGVGTAGPDTALMDLTETIDLVKQLEAHGVSAKQLRIAPKTIEKIVAEYTRESGVRTLDKRIAKIVRTRAKNIGFNEEFRPEVTAEDVEKILGVPRYQNESYEIAGMVGVVTGLAWTEVGGDILYIESILTPGKGGLTMTGNLGDVMKESATIALEWVKAHGEELGIDREKFEKFDVNIHVPEGAIPKDGPSAGITMVTSLVSTFTGRPVRDRVAMTGETTLRGRVMPVGGIKEKILAAKRAGINEIILSEDNRKDISEIKPEYLEGLTFDYVRTNDDVLRLALSDR